MEIIPAIDLYQQQCVRLLHGSFSNITYYKSSPLELAQQYQHAGAKRLHVVDLEGAKLGKSQQLDLIKNIKAKTNLKLQVGGGIRSYGDASKILTNNIDSIVIGSMVINNESEVIKLLEDFSIEKIIFALDVIIENDIPLIAIAGWQQKTKIALWDILNKYKNFNKLQILCTDISRDGALQGPNFELYQQCKQQYPKYRFIASGGIGTIDDIIKLRKTKVDATVIGKALLENKFTLQEVL